MKIFFLAHFYFDLYKPILNELEKQGHDVFLVQDMSLKYDPNVRSLSKLRRLLYKFCRVLLQTEPNHWKRKCKEDIRYNDYYDVFFCINGVSFHPWLLKHLKGRNPQIKCSLYLWDSCKYYNFLRYIDCFDKIFTFDIEDAKLFPNVKVLESFWFPSPPQGIKYKLSMVGLDHDDRISIVSKIYSQLTEAKLPSCFKIVIYKGEQISQWMRLIPRYKKLFDKRNAEWLKKKSLPFTTETKLSVNEVLQIIDESDCILDTDMPVQTGATERVVWALARGKKVISTNNNLAKMPFYDSNQILIIDRKKPVVDLAFLSKTISPMNHGYWTKLRIDNWIKNFIYFG